MSTLVLRIQNWSNVRLLRAHKRGSIYAEGEIIEGSHDFAIFAIYPRVGIIESVLRAIQYLIENDVHVICILNQTQSSSEFASQINKIHPDATILLRPNIGRDFGAYKFGFEYLIKTKKLCNYLYFLNDSIIYTPDFNKVMNKVAEHDNIPWKCLFVNTEHYVHAQSFFLRFSTEIVNSNNFRKFWLDYYPTFQRRKTIRYGEQELSKILLNSHYIPMPYFSHQMVSPEFVNNFTSPEIMALFEKTDTTRLFRWERDEEVLLTRASDIFARRNPTHLLGLPLTRFAGAPLKLDLLKNWSVEVSTIGIFDALIGAGISSEEANQIIFSMLSQGTSSSYTNLRKLWSMHGLI